MPRTRLTFPLLALGAASALALSGCAGTTPTGDAGDTTDDTISVVASTNVYGQIAEEIGGEHVTVTAIIDSGAQDPHSYEASAQDQLHVNTAALLIENGGGYDSFIDSLIEATGTDAPVVTAVEYSHDWPENAGHSDEAGEEAEEDHAHDHDEAGHDHVEGFNEHVWYDPHTIEHVAEGIAQELGELDPDNADEYTANAEAFAADVADLETQLEQIASEHADEQAFLTEPVAGYLVSAAGLQDVTPAAFSEAVEEGQDVAPSTLLEALGLVDSGDLRVVIANAQTGGAETTQIIDEADAQGIPVLEFTETLPEGQTYVSWMQQNIADLAGALAE